MYNAKIFDQTIAEMSANLGLAPDEMYDMVIDNAHAWLMEWTGSEEAVKTWEATPEFWVWWRSLWLDTDMLHLSRLNDCHFEYIRNEGIGLDQYQKWHDPKLIQASPNSVVYESFHRMVKHMAGACKQAINFII